jgi:hypothetical protein
MLRVCETWVWVPVGNIAMSDDLGVHVMPRDLQNSAAAAKY